MELNNKKTTLVVSCLALTMLGHSPHVQAASVRSCEFYYTAGTKGYRTSY